MTEKTWKATLDYFGLEGQVAIVTGAGNRHRRGNSNYARKPWCEGRCLRH